MNSSDSPLYSAVTFVLFTCGTNILVDLASHSHGEILTLLGYGERVYVNSKCLYSHHCVLYGYRSRLFTPSRGYYPGSPYGISRLVADRRNRFAV